MLERITTHESSNGKTGLETSALDELRVQIEQHRKHDQSQSYLGRALSYIWDKDEQSLHVLEELNEDVQAKKQAGDSKGLARLKEEAAYQVTHDREAVAWQDELVHYGSGFLKTAGLFMRGKLGLAGTVAIYALDQMNPKDPFATQAVDFALGGAKGGLLKGTFCLLGEKPVGIATKGVGLGVSSRLLELGLNRSTYLDANTGEVNLKDGLTRVVKGSLDKGALVSDATIFSLAHGLLGKANALSGQAIERSPLLTTMLTGTTFGLSSGATSEILRQNAAGENFDLTQVIKRSLIQGGIDTLAAAPGGIQVDAHFRGQVTSQVKQGKEKLNGYVEELKTRTRGLADSLSLADLLSLDGGLTPALAGIPSGRAVFDLAPRKASSRLSEVLMMMSDGGSLVNAGIDVDALLGSAGPKVPGSSGVPKATGLDATRAAAGFDLPSASAAVVEDPGKAIKPDILSLIKVRTPEEGVAFKAFEQLALKVGNSAAPADKAELFKYLKEHPELEIPIRQYEGVVYDSVTTHLKPGEFTPEEIQARVRIVALIGEFYKPDRGRIFVENQQQLIDFHSLLGLFRGLKVSSNLAATKQTIFAYLSAHPELHNSVKQFASSSNDETVVSVLDTYFGTNNLRALKELNAWRANPKVAQGDIVEKPAIVGPAVDAGSGELPLSTQQGKSLEEARDSNDAANSSLSDLSMSGAAGVDTAGDKGDSVSKSADTKGLVNSGPVPTDVQKVVDESGAGVSQGGQKLADEDAATRERDVVKPPITVSASEIAKGLSDPSIAVRNKAMRLLGDHLSKLTDDEFLSWKEVAKDNMLLGYLLESPDVANVPPSILKRFLSKAETSLGKETPEWAKESTEASRIAQEAKAQESGGRPPRPPREPKDSLQDRLTMLEKALDIFRDNQALGLKMLELGCTDKAAFDGILFSLGHPRFGEAYKSLLKQTVPNASSLEPIKYLFQFIKEGNQDGAFAALQQVRPRAVLSKEAIEAQIWEELNQRPRKELEEIEAELAAAKGLAEGEFDEEVSNRAGELYVAQEGAYNPANVKAKAEQVFKDQGARIQAEWQRLQKLVSDIMTGNIQGPPRRFGGARRGGPRQ